MQPGSVAMAMNYRRRLMVSLVVQGMESPDGEASERVTVSSHNCRLRARSEHAAEGEGRASGGIPANALAQP
ncbi:hypothetical protein CBM2629_A130005 [Cupriavidus taiwanensis]|nr:hypothetical protein CBM2629_A130005 [Cupriavidus taiwanensis]